MQTLLAAALAAAMAALPGAALAQEAQLATFQETAHVVIDREVSGRVTASVVLQSTSGQEIAVPPGVEAALSAAGPAASVVATDAGGCAPGTEGVPCLMVSVGRPGGAGAAAAQGAAREAGDAIAAALGRALGAEPRFHSSYIHSGGGASEAFGTPGAVSGAGAVSAVYEVPGGAGLSFGDLAASLLAPGIREGGGFYDAALALSREEGAASALSAVQQGRSVLYQLRVSADRGPAAGAGPEVFPAELLGAAELRRSSYFDGGFYPLNSVVQVTLVGGGELEPGLPGEAESVERGGLLVPADPARGGWLPESQGGAKVARFLFGGAESVPAGGLSVRISGAAPGGGGDGGEGGGAGDGGGPGAAQLAVLAAIAAGAAGAAALFLRGYGRGG